MAVLLISHRYEIIAGNTPQEQLIKIDSVDVADSTCVHRLQSEDGLTVIINDLDISGQTQANPNDNNVLYHRAFIPIADAAQMTPGTWIWSIEVSHAGTPKHHEEVIRIDALTGYIG